MARKAAASRPGRKKAQMKVQSTAERPTKPQATASSTGQTAEKPVATPVKRVSVVRKPPRAPTVRASRSTPATQERITQSPAPMGTPPAAPPKSRTRSARQFQQQPATGAGVEQVEILGAVPVSSQRTELSSQTPLKAVSVEEQFSIPAGYGDNRIILMVKDPWWLYAYWEIQPSTERAVRGQLLPQEVPELQSILRVSDVTGIDFPAQPANHSFDISLSGLATNWYIQTNAPNRSFIVEIGLLTRTKRFLLLSRSNRVTAPRFGPSEIIDDAWAGSEETYWKLFGATAGTGIGSSPTSWGQPL